MTKGIRAIVGWNIIKFLKLKKLDQIIFNIYNIIEFK